ncbi:hypothetical protein EYF80_020040 [Liparis tanakae]|uniref:Uncharacterized protein n=1 Tax=Liparis tanakae TaxID=230148 RepID=A0A4Z2HUZ8_9TELE|nr:hypothetical protein EYF80_020040 [Liparis tanakae]
MWLLVKVRGGAPRDGCAGGTVMDELHVEAGIPNGFHLRFASANMQERESTSIMQEEHILPIRPAPPPSAERLHASGLTAV